MIEPDSEGLKSKDSKVTERSDEFMKKKKHGLGRLLGHLGLTISGTLSSLLGSGAATVAANAALIGTLAKSSTALDFGFLGKVTADQILTGAGIDLLKMAPPFAIASGILTLGGAAVGWQGVKNGSTLEKLGYVAAKVAEPLAWILTPMLGLPSTVMLVFSGISALSTLLGMRNRK